MSGLEIAPATEFGPLIEISRSAQILIETTEKKRPRPILQRLKSFKLTGDALLLHQSLKDTIEAFVSDQEKLEALRIAESVESKKYCALLSYLTQFSSSQLSHWFRQSL